MRKTPDPRVLILESDPQDADRMLCIVRSHFCPGIPHFRCDPTQALDAETIEKAELVLFSLTGDSDRDMATIGALLEQKPDLPIVVLVEVEDLIEALEAIGVGAYSFVVKVPDYVIALPTVIDQSLEIWRVRQDNLRLSAQLHQTLRMVQRENVQLNEAVEELETVAGTDPLTRLSNRRAIDQAFERSFAECKRHGRDLACIMIDLDGFKAFNDTLGHPMGDELLENVARVLTANCRRSDIAGRFGGDEFILILPDTDRPFAQEVGRRIQHEFQLGVESLVPSHNRPVAVSLSMGLCSINESNPANPQQMIAHADHALYRAKHSGKAQLCVFESEPNRTNQTDRTES